MKRSQVKAEVSRKGEKTTRQMEKRQYRGSITVFLSLLILLFLLLICTVLEGVRIQGAKVRAAACLDMGLFSVFGEYEKNLLSDYHVFFLDGSYGTGNMKKEKITERLVFFMKQNADLTTETSDVDWFRVKNITTEMEEFLTATDENGKAFLRQACLFMEGIEKTKEKNIGMLEAEKTKNKLRLFKQIKTEVMMLAEKTEEEFQEQEEDKINLIKWLEKKQKEDFLEEMVLSGFPVSFNEISEFEKVSERSCIEGNMKIPRGSEKEENLFKDYLFFTFGNAVGQKERNGLQYEQEYLLKGNRSDRENLREVCEELLEIRWADNFLSVRKEEEKKKQAEEIIEIWKRQTENRKVKKKDILVETENVKKTETELFLLAWAYQESIWDVKKLLLGFSVPLEKVQDEWETDTKFWLTENYMELQTKEITDIWNYEGYLRLLFEMKQISNLPMKMLDLIEWEIKSKNETSNFRVDCCIGGMKVETKWQIDPIFFRISNAFLGMGQKEMIYTVKGSFMYEMEE